jgi:putative ABC transport system permease protein
MIERAVLLGAIAGVSLIGRIQIAASNGANQTLQTQVGLDSITVGFGIAAAVGLFFGIFPAARAAQLNPIHALRYE